MLEAFAKAYQGSRSPKYMKVQANSEYTISKPLELDGEYVLEILADCILDMFEPGSYGAELDAPVGCMLVGSIIREAR